MKEMSEEKKDDVTAPKETRAEKSVVARVEQVKTTRNLKGKNRAIMVGILALVAIAAAVAAFIWWRLRKSEEGRPIPAPSTIVRTGQPGTGGTTAPTES